MKRIALYRLLSFLMLLTIPSLWAASGVKHAQKEGKAATSFRVAGEVAKPQTWTATQLKQHFASELRTITYSIKGETAKAQCVPLLSVVQAVLPRLNPKIKNHLLAFTILARSDDGYTIAFSAGELMPDFGGREVWIALDRNGQPLTEEEGPARLLIPGENKKFARWLHGLKSVELVDGSRLLDETEQHSTPHE